MLRLSVLSCLLACLPLASHASTQISLVSTNCSGNMTLSSGSGISLACTGDLNLDGGWLKSDSQISLFASGDLTLNNLSLYAPEITLSTLSGMVSLGSTANIDTTRAQLAAGGDITIKSSLSNQIITWQNFDIGLNPGANLTVGTGNVSVTNRIIGSQSTYLAGSLALRPAQSLPLVSASQLV